MMEDPAIFYGIICEIGGRVGKHSMWRGASGNNLHGFMPEIWQKELKDRIGCKWLMGFP